MSAHPTPERLGAYLDDELDASARAAVDAHLRECAECAVHLADLASLDEAARRLPLAVPAGYFDDFAPRVRARLGKKAPARWRQPVWGWAAAAALLLAVITPLALQGRRGPSSVSSGDAAGAKPPSDVPSEGTFQRYGGPDLKQREAPPPAAAPAVPPATVGAPQAPAPSTGAPQDEDDRFGERAPASRQARRDRDVSRYAGRENSAASGVAAPELQPEVLSKREEAEPAQGTLLDSGKLAEQTEAEQKKADERADELRALGYVAPPPAASQRQHGPRVQNTATARGSVELGKSSAESKDKEQAAAGADAPAAVLQESVEVTPRPRDTGGGPASAKFRSLAEGPEPRSDAEARRLREAWRAFASENPYHPQIDEARVKLVEAGVLTYKLGRRPQDRETALRDARNYLERPDAPQAARVRVAIKPLETGAP